MAFCPNCGNQIEEGGAFCGACGTSVAAPAAPAAPVTPVEPAAPAWSAPVEPTAPAWSAPVESTPTGSWTAPAPSTPAWSAPQTPTYSAPAYNTPAWNTPAQQTTSGGDKAKGIVGMILGISGMVFAIIGFLYVLAFMGFGDGVSFGMAFGFGIFSLPLSIIGKVLAGKSQESGNTSGMCSAGKVMGLIGMILSFVMFFFGFISLTY